MLRELIAGPRWLSWSVIAFAAAVVGLLWWSNETNLRYERVNVARQAEIDVINLARAFAEHTLRTIESVDLSLLTIKQQIESGEPFIDVAERMVRNANLVIAASVADQNGDVTFTTLPDVPPTNIADREHMLVHVAHDQRGLFISKPVLGRQSGKWSVQFTRRINHSDGSFAGVVVASVNPYYFSEFFKSIDIGERGIAALVGVDGVVRALGGPNGSTTGNDLNYTPFFEHMKHELSGSERAVDPLDGILRYYGHRQLANYGMITLVGAADEDVMVSAVANAVRERTQAALLSAAIVVLALILVLQVRKLERSRAASIASHRSAEKAHAEAAAARDRLSMAMEAMSDGFALYDRDDRLVLWNRRYLDTNPAIQDILRVGLKFEELLRTALQRGQIKVAPEERESWITRRLEQRRHPGAKTERALSNGTWILIHERATADGGIVSLGTDITELKRREAELRELAERNAQLAAAIDAASVGVVVTDARRPDNPIVFVNPAFSRITGYAAYEVFGRNPRFLRGPDVPGEPPDPLGPAIREARPITTEIRNYRKDGTPWWNEITVSPIRDRRGDLMGFVGIQNDVTSRKQAAAKLVEAKNEADRASRAKTEFVATISHEIRTPLNGVLGTIALLLETKLSDLQRHYAETAHESGEILLSLLNDVLDFSKMEAGRLELDIADFRVRDVLRTAVGAVQSRARAKSIDLDVNVDNEVPVALRGDSGRLAQIILNLVGNAVKFTEHGAVTLSVHVEASTGPATWLCFEVKDTGVGIAAQDLPRLFSSFTQVDSSRSRRASGTGLGLAICRKLAEMMGGTITVDSEPGIGSTFRVRLPFRAADAVPLLDLAAPDEAPSQRTGHVLVVDDSPTNLLVAKGFLTNAGYQVTTVESGAAAIAAVKQGDFDLVLMDLSMPDIDGIAATWQIRALGGRCAALPIIAMTAHAMDRDRIACLQAGMNDYLRKPVNKRILLKTVEHWIAAGGAPPDKPAGAASPPQQHDREPEPPLAETIDEAVLSALRAELDAETFTMLLGTFVTETTARMDRIAEAAQRHDRESLARESHALKSGAATFGAANLSRLAADIERTAQQARSFPDSATIAALMADAEAACSALKAVQHV